MTSYHVAHEAYSSPGYPSPYASAPSYDRPGPPPPPSYPGRQNQFYQGLPPPPPPSQSPPLLMQHYNYESPIQSVLRSCLSALCCCCILEECCLRSI